MLNEPTNSASGGKRTLSNRCQSRFTSTTALANLRAEHLAAVNSGDRPEANSTLPARRRCEFDAPLGCQGPNLSLLGVPASPVKRQSWAPSGWSNWSLG